VYIKLDIAMKKSFNIRVMLFVIIAIALIIPIFYLVQYLDSVFSYLWSIGWFVFLIALGIVISKTGLQKYLPRTRNSLLIHTFIPIVILSSILVYVTIILRYFSLPLFCFFGGLIALILVIYGIRVKTGW
jgi:hypothetical protein